MRYRLDRDGATVYEGAALAVDDASGLVAGQSYAYTLYVDAGGGYGSASATATGQALDASGGDASVCGGDAGTIQQLNYDPNLQKTWTINPTVVDYSTITFTVDIASVPSPLSLAL